LKPNNPPVVFALRASNFSSACFFLYSCLSRLSNAFNASSSFLISIFLAFISSIIVFLSFKIFFKSSLSVGLGSTFEYLQGFIDSPHSN